MWWHTRRNLVFRRNGRVHLNRPRGASVQSTTGSRGVRISDSNAGYKMFRGSVKSTGYPLHSPVSPSLPLPCVSVCHDISTGVYLLCVCVCVCVYVHLLPCYIFSLHQCIFSWSYVQSSRYSAPAIFIIANRLRVPVHVYSVSHSLPVVIMRHIVYSLWIWIEMWDRQMICWYEVNIGNCSGADGDKVGRNLYGKKIYVGNCAVECSWMLMGFGDGVGLPSLRLSGCWTLYKKHGYKI